MIDLANLIGRAEAEGELLGQTLEGLPDNVSLDGESVNASSLLAGARALLSGEREWLFLELGSNELTPLLGGRTPGANGGIRLCCRTCFSVLPVTENNITVSQN